MSSRHAKKPARHSRAASIKSLATHPASQTGATTLNQRREIYGLFREALMVRAYGYASEAVGEMMRSELELVLKDVEKQMGDRID